jgi:hypothetical protein
LDKQNGKYPAASSKLQARNSTPIIIITQRRHMNTDSFFALMCVSVIALFLGFVMAFNGYRLFQFLLPIWGFFFGFGLGAQTVQAIFGTGFLSNVTGWVVGFVVALVFAVLSYLFYFVAVALLGASVGYALGSGVVLWLLPSFNITAWIVGIVVALIFAVGVWVLNIQKWVIIGASAIIGAGLVVGTMLFALTSQTASQVLQNPVQSVLNSNFLFVLLFVGVALFGALAQIRTSRYWQIESYNRWDEMNVASV